MEEREGSQEWGPMRLACRLLGVNGMIPPLFSRHSLTTAFCVVQTEEIADRDVLLFSLVTCVRLLKVCPPLGLAQCHFWSFRLGL